MITTWRELQHTADEFDTQIATFENVALVRLNENDDILCWWSSSAPKKLAALLRIAIARFISRSS
jgi:hypothetical protein